MDLGSAAARLPGARAAPQPRSLRPQLATLAREAPAGEGWLHEIKYDGYRLIAVLDGGRARLLTRTGQDWSDRFPDIERALAALPVPRAILDGEAVVFDRDGRSDFQALQNSLGSRSRGSSRSRGKHAFCVFDLPHCAGQDLTAVPLLRRKELLERLLAAGDAAVLRYSEHVAGSGPEFRRHACQLGLEGAVSKRADARYQSARTRTWIKSKCLARQEFVVGGMSAPAGSRTGFGALLLGTYDEGGELRFAGRVGTGFTDRSLRELERALLPLAIERPPFADPPRGAAARGVRWLRPEVVVEVEFTGWTEDGILRHPSFRGVREDKRPREVRREGPAGGADPPARGAAEPRRNDPPQRADALAATGVRMSHPERVLWPEQGVTKRELADYYATIADFVLPHVVGRPLTLLRCPRGRTGHCFYQKHATEGLAAPVRSVPVRERSGTRDYVAIDDLAGLVALVQLGVLELHPWGCRRDRLDRPDRLVIDLDPGPQVAFARVVAAAQRLRELLEELDLASFARTTGGKGLHVVLPIDRRSTWDEARGFARDLVARLQREQPDDFVLTAGKAERRGRIFLDWLRNHRGATAVASYSTRARPGATVATPLLWREVAPDLDPAAFSIRTVPARLRRGRDPWQGFFEVRQSLTRSVRAAVRGR